MRYFDTLESCRRHSPNKICEYNRVVYRRLEITNFVSLLETLYRRHVQQNKEQSDRIEYHTPRN